MWYLVQTGTMSVITESAKIDDAVKQSISRMVDEMNENDSLGHYIKIRELSSKDDSSSLNGDILDSDLFGLTEKVLRQNNLLDKVKDCSWYNDVQGNLMQQIEN